MISDVDHTFQDWADEFKHRPASIYDVQGNLVKKCLVKDILGNVLKLKLARRDSPKLEQNVLYACFKAATAPPPDEDSAAKHREFFKEQFSLIDSHRQDVARIRDYLADQREMACKAMAHADPPGAQRRHHVTNIVLAEVDDFMKVLSRYETGLTHIADWDHPAHISADDFRYGPFEMHNDLYEMLAKPKNINQTGLMFHLAYLFRYFTSHTSSIPRIDIGRDILDVQGEMLSDGRPHHELVAPLVNAVFDLTLSASKVKDRLRDLVRFTKGSLKPENPLILKHPVFVGWS